MSDVLGWPGIYAHCQMTFSGMQSSTKWRTVWISWNILAGRNLYRVRDLLRHFRANPKSNIVDLAGAKGKTQIPSWKNRYRINTDSYSTSCQPKFWPLPRGIKGCSWKCLVSPNLSVQSKINSGSVDWYDMIWIISLLFISMYYII